jgi:hypothetical protein
VRVRVSLRVRVQDRVPGFRLRTPHRFETACLNTGAAVMAKPTSTTFFPTLWAARCVPFTMAAERDVTVFRIMLSVQGKGSEGEVVID